MESITVQARTVPLGAGRELRLVRTQDVVLLSLAWCADPALPTSPQTVHFATEHGEAIAQAIRDLVSA